MSDDDFIDEDKRAEGLLVGLDDYELEDEDRALLSGEYDPSELGAVEASLPVVAVVGRPNVGKSALVNRILGRREAVVQDIPGVTRDRVSYPAEWNDRRFTLMDTGGWEPDAKGLDQSVAVQAEVAIDLADVIIFVVDSRVGATATDERVVTLLRTSGVPVVVAANKVDDQGGEADATVLWSLGLGEPWPVSALHGRGVADMLDHILTLLPKEAKTSGLIGPGPRRIALVGKPNVGKSSLLNKAAREERVVVNPMAGTTRDPVDELVEIGGETWRFVDTAGIRKKVHLQQGADFYASLRTQAALEKAEVAVVVIDVTEEVSEQDMRIIDLVVESGRALVLAFNKWDLLDDERRRYLEREIETDLDHVAWAPRVNISAKTGRHLEKLPTALHSVLESWDRRISTGALNAFIAEISQSHPHPVRGGKQPRILYATQAATRPPTFVFFTTGFLDPQYRRFIQRRLREDYGFEGTPIRIQMRVRERRSETKRR